MRRYLKTIIFISLFFILLLPAKSIEDSQNILMSEGLTITPLEINAKRYLTYDIEAYTTSRGEILLPVKEMLKLFEIDYKQSHLNHQIDFNTGKLKGYINPQTREFYIDNQKSFMKSIKYVEQGIFPTTKQEIFVSKSTIAKILNAKLDYNSELSLYEINSEDLPESFKKLITKNESFSFDSDYVSEDDKLESLTLKKPEEKKKAGLNYINFNSRTDIRKTTEDYQNISTTDNNTQSTTNIEIGADIFDGKFKLSTDINSTDEDAFLFGEIYPVYEKDFDNARFKLGSVDGYEFGQDYSLASNTLGVGFTLFDDKYQPYSNEIKGELGQDEVLNIYVDNEKSQNPDVLKGFYSISDYKKLSDNPIYKLKVDKTNGEGETTLIEEKYVSVDPDLLPKGVVNYNFLTGATNYNNLFNSNQLQRSHKWVGSIVRSQGLTNNLKLETGLIADSLIDNYDNNTYGEDRATLSLINGSTRDMDNVNGQTVLNTITFKPNTQTKIKADMGLSKARAKDTGEKLDGSMIRLKAEKEMERKRLSSEIYYYAPDFYFAGSQLSEILNDRKGVKGSYSDYFDNGIYFRTYGNHYISNLENRGSSGENAFNNLSFYTKTPFVKNSNLSIGGYLRTGDNDISERTDDNIKLTLNKRLSNRSNFNTSIQYNILEQNTASSSNTTDRVVHSASTSYTFSRNKGTLYLGHDINLNDMKNSSGAGIETYNNNYNSVNLGYAFPRLFDKVTTVVNTNFKYTGDRPSADASLRLGYLLKNGLSLNMTYRYSQQDAIASLDESQYNRHSLVFDISGSLCQIGSLLKPRGLIYDDVGFVEVNTFLDVNKDGIWQKDKEPKIPYIALNVPGDSKAKTGKKGVYTLKPLQEGFYKVGLDLNQLPVLLSLAPEIENEYLVKIDKLQSSYVDFGFVSSVGNVSGKVNLINSLGQEVKEKNVIICLYDEKGKEVDYTAIEDDSTFSFHNLNPGKYIIKVDKDIAASLGLIDKGQGLKEITIPPVFDKFVNIEDIEVKYYKEHMI